MKLSAVDALSSAREPLVFRKPPRATAMMRSSFSSARRWEPDTFSGHRGNTFVRRDEVESGVEESRTSPQRDANVDRRSFLTRSESCKGRMESLTDLNYDGRTMDELDSMLQTATCFDSRPRFTFDRKDLDQERHVLSRQSMHPSFPARPVSTSRFSMQTPVRDSSSGTLAFQTPKRRSSKSRGASMTTQQPVDDGGDGTSFDIGASCRRAKAGWMTRSISSRDFYHDGSREESPSRRGSVASKRAQSPMPPMQRRNSRVKPSRRRSEDDMKYILASAGFLEDDNEGEVSTPRPPQQSTRGNPRRRDSRKSCPENELKVMLSKLECVEQEESSATNGGGLRASKSHEELSQALERARSRMRRARSSYCSRSMSPSSSSSCTRSSTSASLSPLKPSNRRNKSPTPPKQRPPRDELDCMLKNTKFGKSGKKLLGSSLLPRSCHQLLAPGLVKRGNSIRTLGMAPPRNADGLVKAKK